ncbi:hypothetical protein SDC9_151255 [bioreactor metagenome]|uniref:Uncharacterized protein n=1 Tax=bioreactor metagenome TaxID=1076179 RepID=A0A645ES53_9ZZZZ
MTCRPRGGGQMPLLMRKSEKRDAERRRQIPARAFSCEETRHIRARDLARPRACRHGDNASKIFSAEQRLHNFRKPLHMKKQSVALPQTESALRHVENAACVPPCFTVEHRGRRGIIACVKSEDKTFHLHSARSNAPNMPLTKEATSGSSYFFASSTASFIAAPFGMSGI